MSTPQPIIDGNFIAPARIPLHRDFLRAEASINARFIAREECVRAALLALLTRHNCVFIGPPGTAKSMIVECVARHFGELLYFSRQLSKYTLPEDVFGPHKISALRQDKFVRQIQGYLPTAEVGLLDEFTGRAGQAMMDTLLKITNERIFDNGDEVVKVPLISLFAASNTCPTDSGLDAIWDRMLLRTYVKRLTDKQFAQYLEFLEDKTSPEEFHITRAQLFQAQTEVAQVSLHDDTVPARLELRKLLKDAGIDISERRWRGCSDILRASAWLAGRTEALEDDIETLKLVLWLKPEQINDVSLACTKAINPFNSRAQELLMQAESVIQTLDAQLKTQGIQGDATKTTAVILEHYNKIKKIEKDLDKLHKDAKSASAKLDLIETTMIQVSGMREGLSLRVNV